MLIRAIVQDDLIVGYRDSKGKIHRLSYEDFIESENELVALEDYWCCSNPIAVPYIFPDSTYPLFGFELDYRRDSWITGVFDLWYN